MLIAWLKLRKRNLGPILDANGWAVNAKAKLNVPFGASLTGIPKLPPGSSVSADDRFGEKPSGWIGFAKFVVVVGFIISLLNHFYVLDLIAHSATGKHYPFFKQRPAEIQTSATVTSTTSATSTNTVLDVTVTNAPVAK